MRLGRGGLGLAALTLAACAAAAQDREGWQGRYRYAAQGGRTAGGTGIVVTYDLVIGPPGARDGCQLSAQGFQTDERILCRVRPEGRGLTVSFHRYADGRTVNRYGVAVYAPDQPLFTLVQDKGALTTRLRGLRPPRDGDPDSGPFFERVR